MKYRLPKGCTGVSHAGSPLAVAADGTIDLDPASALALAPHGLIAVPEPKASPAPQPGRRDERTVPDRR